MSESARCVGSRRVLVAPYPSSRRYGSIGHGVARRQQAICYEDRMSGTTPIRYVSTGHGVASP
eukprot:387208-Rhodomonas_salina.1